MEVYTASDIPEQLQDIVITAFHNDLNYVIDTVIEETHYRLKEDLQEIMPEFKDFRYVLTYSQGSGASWEGSVLFSNEYKPPFKYGIFALIDLKKEEIPNVVNKLMEYCGEPLKNLRKVAAEHRLKGWAAPEVQVKYDLSSNYVHERTMKVDVLLDSYHPIDWFYRELKNNNVENTDLYIAECEKQYLDNVEEDIQEFTIGLARLIYDHMYYTYEQTYTWEWIADYLNTYELMVLHDKSTNAVIFKHVLNVNTYTYDEVVV